MSSHCSSLTIWREYGPCFLFPEVVFSVLGVGAAVDSGSLESVGVLCLTLNGKEGIFCLLSCKNIMLALSFKNKFHGRAFRYSKVQ